MFTGIVLEVAEVTSLQPLKEGLRLGLHSRIPETQDLALGSSIALNGACLTLVEKSDLHQFYFELSPETLKLSNLGLLKVGDTLNLEPALRLGDPLGGHLVSGHVDAMGRVDLFQQEGEFWLLKIRIEDRALKEIGPYLVAKGSITVDGVSLTVNQVEDFSTEMKQSCVFSVLLIPHTLSKTCLPARKIGDSVNLEADILAKYVNRYADFNLRF